MVVRHERLGDDRQRGAVLTEVRVEQVAERRGLLLLGCARHPLEEPLEEPAELADLGVHDVTLAVGWIGLAVRGDDHERGLSRLHHAQAFARDPFQERGVAQSSRSRPAAPGSVAPAPSPVSADRRADHARPGIREAARSRAPSRRARSEQCHCARVETRRTTSRRSGDVDRGGVGLRAHALIPTIGSAPA